jgi:hypothetical protein
LEVLQEKPPHIRAVRHNPERGIMKSVFRLAARRAAPEILARTLIAASVS